MAKVRTYRGSCHCGAVAFEAELDPGQAIECDCSHCWRKGFQLVFIKPEQFELKRGFDSLTEYRFNTRRIAHRFCARCGVQPFGFGRGPDGAETVAVNLRALEDLEPWSVTPERVHRRDA